MALAALKVRTYHQLLAEWLRVLRYHLDGLWLSNLIKWRRWLSFNLFRRRLRP